MPPISVPSTRVYAMKHDKKRAYEAVGTDFSTLDSGLRDETNVTSGGAERSVNFSTLDSGLRDETQDRGADGGNPAQFQYPRLGSTR